MKPIQELRITLHADPPRTWRIRVRPALNGLMAGTLTLFILFAGTLLFFRELEINRKLLERLLVLETTGMLAARRAPASEPVQPAPALVAPKVIHLPPTEAVTAPETTGASVPLASSRPRLRDVAVECGPARCNARVTILADNRQGGLAGAEGSLVAALELEVPRTEAGSGHGARKTFIVYPGMQAESGFTAESAQGIEGKPFRVARALVTQLAFDVPEVLRPVALQVYVFDQDRILVQHKRRTIETPPAESSHPADEHPAAQEPTP